MSVVHARPLPELGSQLAMYNFVRQPAVDGRSVADVTNKNKGAVHP